MTSTACDSRQIDKSTNRSFTAVATGPCVTSAHDGCTASTTEIDVPQTTRLISCSVDLAPVATSSPCQTTAKRVHGICSTTFSLRHLQAWPQHGYCWLRERKDWDATAVCSKRGCRYDVILRTGAGATESFMWMIRPPPFSRFSIIRRRCFFPIVRNVGLRLRDRDATSVFWMSLGHGALCCQSIHSRDCSRDTMLSPRDSRLGRTLHRCGPCAALQTQIAQISKRRDSTFRLNDCVPCVGETPAYRCGVSTWMRGWQPCG